MSRFIHALRARQVGRAAFALLLTIGISSCGGGGENAGMATALPDTPVAAPAPVPSSTPQPQAAPQAASSVPPDAASGQQESVRDTLIISEVATSYYSNDLAWLEVHNPTAAPVNLSGYTLHSSHIDLDTGSNSNTPMAFALPDVAVPARGFLVIAGKSAGQLRDGAQTVYVKNGRSVPFWNADGSVELRRDGVTADFIRFGASTAAPATAGEWNGAAVAALPSGPDEHGKSIVRLHAGGMADTNTAADWVLVNFATPAGRNDVPPGVIDSDGDGIPDSAKVSGGTYAGLDLYAMGARRGRRDIFIEIDHMSSSDIAITPRREALQKMQDAFAAKGIALHLDAGSLYSTAFDPAGFNLGGGNAAAFSPCIDLDTLGAPARDGCGSFRQFKDANFDVRRKFVFHYALFANSQNLDGSAGPSGIAEMVGNDLIVTLGGYSFSTASDEERNMLINMQAGTLMHEFGHNLGLRHGGDEDANYKPNHYSVMNYMYQFAGLSSAPDSASAADRYYLANGLKGVSFCGLQENSPCTDAFRMDFSDGRGAPLDETKLSEAANIGYGSNGGAYADWNNDGVLTAGTVGRNINPLNGYGRSILRDYDEWDNLTISFARNYSGSNSGRSLTAQPRVARINPMSDVHPHHKVDEEPLPHALRQEIRNLCVPRKRR